MSIKPIMCSLIPFFLFLKPKQQTNHETNYTPTLSINQLHSFQSNIKMPEPPADGRLPYAYTLPMEYIDDKVKVKQELDKIYKDIFFKVEEISGNFVIQSGKPGPANLMKQLQDAGAMRKDPKPE